MLWWRGRRRVGHEVIVGKMAGMPMMSVGIAGEGLQWSGEAVQ